MFLKKYLGFLFLAWKKWQTLKINLMLKRAIYTDFSQMTSQMIIKHFLIDLLLPFWKAAIVHWFELFWNANIYFLNLLNISSKVKPLMDFICLNTGPEILIKLFASKLAIWSETWLWYLPPQEMSSVTLGRDLRNIWWPLKAFSHYKWV